MKKITFLMMAVAALAFQACKSHTSSGNTDSTNMTSTTTDTTKVIVADTGKTTATIDSADMQFASKAAIGGMVEVALANLVLTKTSNTKIKDFANMMVADHGKANADLAAIAKTKNIALPVDVDAEHRQKMEELSNLSGKDFDKAYVAAMVDGHQKTLKLMEDESVAGKDADLKAFAVKTTPVVTMHLSEIKKISAGMK